MNKLDVNDGECMCCKEMPKGKTLKIADEVENWGSFKIGRKTIRYKTVILEVRKIKGGTLAYRTTTIFDDGRPAVNASRDSATVVKEK